MKKWLSIALKLAPFVLLAIPGVPPMMVPLIVEAISAAEQIPGATGPAKKEHVLVAVSSGIAMLNSGRGGEIIDPRIVANVVSPAIDVTVGVINAVNKSQKPKQ